MTDKYNRAHLFIKGNVTGVGYRYWALKQAQVHNITGWVRNVNNGLVEALFEGKKEDIGNMVSQCNKGPDGASVKKVKVRWQEAKREYHNFVIKR